MAAISPRYHENRNPPSLLPSPNSRSSNSSCSSSSNSNGAQHQNHHHLSAPPPPTPTAPPPPPPKPITRSESANPYPTTFVQADTSSFKQVVQMLTGSSETAKQASSKPNNPNSDPSFKSHIPPVKSMPMKQQSGFIYKRRNPMKNLSINPSIPSFSSNNSGLSPSGFSPSGFSPRKPEILSPSILDFPSLVLSPVTPLIPDPFDRSVVAGYRCAEKNGNPSLDTEAEEKAIKEKSFFLHPSPATTPRDSEPRLLPLFPTTSPRASGSSS